MPLLLVFTVTNLWILAGGYLECRAFAENIRDREAMGTRFAKYGAFVGGLALAAVIKGHAPTATRLGLTDSVLLVGAIAEGAICVVLVYWLTSTRRANDQQ